MGLLLKSHFLIQEERGVCFVKYAPNAKELLKAHEDEQFEKEVVQKARVAKPKSAFIDPLSSTSVMGTRQKSAIIPYQTLRRMAKVPAVAAVILTRLNQVSRFAKRPRFDGDAGFEIGLKDADRKMTDAESKKAKEIEEFLLRTGSVENRMRKDNFERFLRKIVYDSLVLDAVTWENVYNRKGDLVEIWAVDAATIELVASAPTGELDPPPVYVPVTRRGIPLQGRIAYIQRVNGQIVAEYTEDELAYGVRNPRTEIEFADFGLSELEILIEIITGIINGVRYNTAYFSHSYLPQGVLEVIGKYNDEDLEAFRRYLQVMTSGAVGKWAVPLMALEDGQGFKFTPFKNSNKDMEFNEFLEFLFNLTCAVYQIDPNEVGFKSWTSSNSMSQTDNTEAKIEHSKDKGFAPLMNFLSSMIQSEIIDRIAPDFEFRWVGIDEEDEDQKLERIEKRLSMGLTTVYEERKRLDMEDIKGDDGKPALWTKAPANPQLLQVFMHDLQMEQAEHQQQLQEQSAEAQHQREMEQSQMEHQQALEQAQVQHQHAMEQAEQQHAHTLDQAEKEHQQTVEQEDRKHQMEMERAEKEAEMKPVQPNSSKKKLQKSINELENLLEIEISWDTY